MHLNKADTKPIGNNYCQIKVVEENTFNRYERPL